MKLLNIGCGAHYHPNWINIDLVARGPDVIQYDLRRGLPFDEQSIDVVYHSHVLEHLTPDDGREYVNECYRVLKPGGILRVVVPDLEMIARLYLSALHGAADGDCDAEANHRWMSLELLDQMVRTTSGGQMARYVTDPNLPNEQFVQSRTGEELFPMMNSKARPKRKGFGYRLRKLGKRLARFRQTLAGFAVLCVAGTRGYSALVEGQFRQSGEVHRWMYDRVSLKNLLEDVGFIQVQRCAANESRIDHFSEYELDATSGRIRKPDSLFMEAMKPLAESAAVRSAA